MVHYRRQRVAGGTYFFTVTLHDRGATTLVTHIDYLRAAMASTIRERRFRIDAMVVLPDHLHALWTLPPDDVDYSTRWKMLKARFTRALVKSGVSLQRNGKGEYDLWQRRFWEHTKRDDEDLLRHMDYIHYNPVKHGHVARVVDWPYSTFHRYVRAGVYSYDWGGGVDIRDTETGE